MTTDIDGSPEVALAEEVSMLSERLREMNDGRVRSRHGRLGSSVSSNLIGSAASNRMTLEGAL